MENSGISWTTHTFNPWRGCSKVSPGCANCYAETLSGRNPKTLGVWGPSGTRVVAAESQWKLPRKWNRTVECNVRHGGPRPRVFCASLADVFEGRETMPESSWLAIEAARVRLFHLISETPNLDWLLLTKRPENVRRLCGGDGVPRSWSESMPPNVWLGVSVENQAAADERIPHLLKIPAAVRFLSCEPLLGEISLSYEPGKFGHVPGRLLDGIQWVIVGGESGHDARPCQLDWVRSLQDQCQAAGVACFVKQLGRDVRWMPSRGPSGAWPDHVRFDYESRGEESCHRIRLRDPKGGDMGEWPSDLRIREFPEVAR